MTTKLASSTIEARLGDLLAVIHRDGGHRQDEVGTEQAWMEAMMTVPFLLEAKDAAALGAGYAAGIEDAAKVADYGAERATRDWRQPVAQEAVRQVSTEIAEVIRSYNPSDPNYCAAIRSLPQPAPAEDALRLIHDTFAKDIEQGYVTADKTFAVEIARQALTGTKGDGG